MNAAIAPVRSAVDRKRDLWLHFAHEHPDKADEIQKRVDDRVYDLMMNDIEDAPDAVGRSAVFESWYMQCLLDRLHEAEDYLANKKF